MLTRTPNPVAVIGLILISVALPFVGSGCGSKGEAAISTTPTPALTTAQVPQAVVSPNEKELPFSDIVPRWKAVANGQVVYYYFSYADRDGRVHRCELPKAMSEGRLTRSAWDCTFQVYEIHPEVAPQPVVVQTKQVDMDDFPFVSPPSNGPAISQAQLAQTQGNLPQQNDYNQPIAPGLQSAREIDLIQATTDTVRTVGQTDQQWQATQQAGAEARQRLRENGDNRF